jgi:hypothetical protein
MGGVSERINYAKENISCRSAKFIFDVKINDRGMKSPMVRDNGA